MTKKEKRLARIRQNPKNVSFNELRQVLEDYGFVMKRSRGSHHIFDAQVDEQILTLTIPLTKPHLKAVYVKEALKAIEAIIALQPEDEDEVADE